MGPQGRDKTANMPPLLSYFRGSIAILWLYMRAVLCDCNNNDDNDNSNNNNDKK